MDPSDGVSIHTSYKFCVLDYTIGLCAVQYSDYIMQ